MCRRQTGHSVHLHKWKIMIWTLKLSSSIVQMIFWASKYLLNLFTVFFLKDSNNLWQSSKVMDYALSYTVYVFKLLARTKVHSLLLRVFGVFTFVLSPEKVDLYMELLQSFLVLLLQEVDVPLQGGDAGVRVLPTGHLCVSPHSSVRTLDSG